MRYAKISALACAAALFTGCATLDEASSNISCMLSRATGVVDARCGDGPAVAGGPVTTTTANTDRFAQLQTVLDRETQSAQQAQMQAVAAMHNLPVAQRAVAGPVATMHVAIEDSKNPGSSRSMRTFDSITVDMPLAAKGRAEYTRAMDILKDLANQLSDNRGGATIEVLQSQADIQSGRVNTATGITKTPKGNPVSVQKHSSSSLKSGIERYTIRAGAIRGKL